MNRKMLLTLVCAGSLVVGACSKSGGEHAAGAAGGMGAHGASAGKGAEAPAPGTEMVAVIKGQKLAQYASPTIGEAFGAYSYFEKTEWKQSKAASGKIYVDFVGWLKPGMVESLSGKADSKVKGVEVKFVIYSDGAFDVAMVSTIEDAGEGRLAARPQGEIRHVIDAIYANREIKL